MSIAQVKDLVELVMLVAACLAPVIWIVLEKRIDTRLDAKLEPVHDEVGQIRECTENLEGRTAALEWFRDQNAQNINAIPRSMVILERLEGTLERLDNTLGDVGTRLARIEGPHK